MRWCCAAPTCESPCCSVGGEGSCGVALWVPVPSPAFHSDTLASLQLHGGFRCTSRYPCPSILVPPSHSLDAFHTSPREQEQRLLSLHPAGPRSAWREAALQITRR